MAPRRVCTRDGVSGARNIQARAKRPATGLDNHFSRHQNSIEVGLWPEDRAADEDEIIASAVPATARMEKKGAHLNKAGAYLADRLTDLRWRDWIVSTMKVIRRRVQLIVDLVHHDAA